MVQKPALLLVAHGERGGAGDDRLVHELAERLQERGDYSQVRGCFISKEPSLKGVFADLTADFVTIYPLFMSDGYFVQKSIPEAIDNSRPVTMLTPVGLNPLLPRLIAKMASQSAMARGWAPDSCRLLLAAHGSKYGRASHNATSKVASDLEAMGQFCGVSMGFLEETPFLAEQLSSISGPVLVVGMFIGQGMHGSDDLLRAVDGCQRDDVELLPPMTTWQGFAELICDGLTPSANSDAS